MMNAITFGRYNFFTIAHLDTVKEILKIWENLYILIVDNDLGKTNDCIEGYEEFYNLCDKNHKEKQIFFNMEERIKMINLALEKEGIIDRVTVLAYCRPEYNIEKFNCDFNKNSFSLVFPCTGTEEEPFDKIRNICFEAILKRKVFSVSPKTTIHVSQILSQDFCDEKILSVLPKGTREYFQELEGCKRLVVDF